jgi:hypothetical protein
MSVSSATFSDIGGAVSDLFAGFSATTQAGLKAEGLNISAQGTRLKAQGDLAQASEYDLAGNLATANEQYTETSTAIKEMQQQRSNTLQIGTQQADIAGAGFANSGSALDILADSASQGALAKAVLGQQGLITEAGYTEQANSFATMAAAARTDAAGQDTIANETDQLAQQTIAAGQQSATGDFIGGAIKGIAAVASVFAAPVTGGASLAGLAALASMGGGAATPTDI